MGAQVSVNCGVSLIYTLSEFYVDGSRARHFFSSEGNSLGPILLSLIDLN